MPTKLEEFSLEKLKALEEKSLKRALNQIERIGEDYVIYQGKKLLSFSCNDYLGFSHSNIIKSRVEQIIKAYDIGSGGGASRLISGNYELYSKLETLLAKLYDYPNSIVFGSGYLANIGIIQALAGKFDLIVADKLVHASIIDGIKLSGATSYRFKHNNIENCSEILAKYRHQYRNCLIVTEGVFSMDGDMAPIYELSELAHRYNAWLVSDDAHLLKSGCKVDIKIGTLSKAFGSYGGYVCAEKSVIDYLIASARSLIYSTSLPPMVVASSIAAVELILENQQILDLPLNNAKYFCKLLGLPIPCSQIIPLIIGSAKSAIEAQNKLIEEGFLVAAIRPPTVQPGKARLRFSFSATHKKGDIERLCEIIKSKLNICIDEKE